MQGIINKLHEYRATNVCDICCKVFATKNPDGHPSGN